MSKKRYRSANIIIQTLLEGILRSMRDKSNPHKGIIKTHLVDYCGLKSTTAEKYLSKLEKAGYISSQVDNWGDRTIKIYQITNIGRERYQWFVQINSEIED